MLVHGTGSLECARRNSGRETFEGGAVFKATLGEPRLFLSQFAAALVGL